MVVVSEHSCGLRMRLMDNVVVEAVFYCRDCVVFHQFYTAVQHYLKRIERMSNQKLYLF